MSAVGQERQDGSDLTCHQAEVNEITELPDDERPFKKRLVPVKGRGQLGSEILVKDRR